MTVVEQINYSLKAQLMKNKPKECFEKNVPLKLSVTFFLRYQAKKSVGGNGKQADLT